MVHRILPGTCPCPPVYETSIHRRCVRPPDDEWPVRYLLLSPSRNDTRCDHIVGSSAIMRFCCSDEHCRNSGTRALVGMNAGLAIRLASGALQQRDQFFSDSRSRRQAWRFDACRIEESGGSFLDQEIIVSYDDCTRSRELGDQLSRVEARNALSSSSQHTGQSVRASLPARPFPRHRPQWDRQ